MSGFDDYIDAEIVAAPAWYQLAVMVNDGSGSMTLQVNSGASAEGDVPHGTKAAAVDIAVRMLVKEMQEGRSSENYHFAFVSFNTMVTDARPPRKLAEIPRDETFDPTAHGTGGTAIYKGLEAAASIVEAYLQTGQAQELPVSAVVAVMSDGEENSDVQQTQRIAERIRGLRNTSLAACLFATRDQPAAGGSLLASIVSEPRLFQHVYDAAGLRKFFKDSITASRPALPPGQ
ncbi:MAG TPA: vWA domain-containing protein [Solirubrobacteraceae bacterium]|jgi:uncharacterized protein YegL